VSIELIDAGYSLGLMKGNVMDANELSIASELTHKQQVEDTIIRWYFLLENGRQALHASNWQEAVVSYRAAYTEVELLVFTSDCKNCAVKNYVRTLAEYSYALCKLDKVEQLPDLIVQAWYTLNTCLTEALASRLLQPLRSMEYATSAERDVWINQLFAEEATHRKQVH
jgi:hypothetical protein